MAFNKKEAKGGNFKVKGLKVFGSKENLYLNEKKYRRVYDISESRFIYCEFSFYNKLFDEAEWDAEVKVVCVNLSNSQKMAEIDKSIKVSKELNVIYVREGWGTPDPGWWKKGKYQWEVFLEDKSVGTTMFYVVDGGKVSPQTNPYFDIRRIRLFESPKFGTPIGERTYLQTFDSKKTRYVNIELTLVTQYREQDFFPLELTVNIFNDSGQFKASMYYFKDYIDDPEEIILDAGYGSENIGFWYKDQYTMEIIFMDQMIAVVPFEVDDAEQPLEGEHSFSQIKDLDFFLTDEDQEVPITFEEAKQELEGLIGLKSVKRQINDLAAYLQFLKIRSEKGIEDNQDINLHTVFTGNPGTGKTTVASMLGKIYKSLGLLSTTKVIEVGRAELVGEFIGQTAPKVKAVIEKARGGILFIDEAYALTNRGNDGKDFGKEVIEVLLKELSDGPGDLAIIFAGYPKQMKNFLLSNPGLASRLRNIIHFPDYSPDELLEIAEYTAGKKGIVLNKEATDNLYKKLIEAYRNRDEQFGNARFVVGIVEEAKQHMALRLMQNSEGLADLEDAILSTVTEEDINSVFKRGIEKGVKLPIDEALLNDTLDNLHELVGLENIKREIDEMVKLVRYYQEIGKDIRKSFSLHSVFMGNPGTGKTTVARLIVKIYKSLGILERGHLVEVDRKALVAGFVGQTAIKTAENIDKAMGGGLFIDEAYSLTSGGQSDFGREAIEILLKRMEDQRGEFMVIAAGYPEEMRKFIEANPGLMSRFDKQYIFEDYNETELLDIAKVMFEDQGLHLNKEASNYLNEYIIKLVQNKHKYFGNARTIRKIVAESVRKQHLRMADLAKNSRTTEMTKTIRLEDISDFKLLEADLEKKKGIGFR